jgi:DNA invertase Pin-like site-specific DNA recombinase
MSRSKTKKTVAIYARVSTNKQKTEMQLAELRAYVKRSKWKTYKEYIDHGRTGADTSRPAFTQMMADAAKKKFDILLVWKLDRLSRSMRDLVNTISEIEAAGLDFISYENQLDTSTPTGKLVFHVIGAVAEFERDIIRERVRAGLDSARRRGQRLGRPPHSKTKRTKARRLRQKGGSLRAIARTLKVSEGSIRNWLK